MASEMIGRGGCPECGFEKAHIKKKDEPGKFPYRHCPECGAQYFTRNQRQAENLMKTVRGEKAAAVVAVPEKVASPIVPYVPPKKPKKVIFGVEVDA